MFLEDLHLDGADSGAITWGDEIPAEVKADAHVVVIGCGEAGSSPASAWPRPACRSRSSRRTPVPAARGGTTATRAPGSTSAATSTATRSSRPTTGASTSPSSPSCRTTSPGCSTTTTSGPHCRFEHRGRRRRLRRGDRPLGASTVDGADGTEEVLDARFVISAVGALNQPKLPDIPGMDDFAGPSFHSARWDPDVDYTGTRFALVGAGASGFQIAPTIADDVEQPHHLPAHRAVDVPERRTTTERCPTGERWAMRHLPFYGRWFRFLIFYPASGLIDGPQPHRPRRATTAAARISEGNAQTRELFAGWIASQLERPARPARGVASRTTRRRPSACSRTTARGWRA